jgi:hypothetical protein
MLREQTKLDTRLLIYILGLLTAVSSCDSSESASPVTTTSTITTTTAAGTETQVMPIESEGPVQIEFVGSEPEPGSTISGCGPHVQGCTERLRVTPRLVSPQDGASGGMSVYLHAMNQTACLSARRDRFELRAGEPRVVEVVLDRADSVDRCATPLTIATMDAIIDGPIQISSRQAWSLTYLFNP